MDQSEEKFFAELAGAKLHVEAEPEEEHEEGNYEVELARADTGAAVARTKKVMPKIIDRNDTAWDDDDQPEGQLTVDVYQTPTEIVVESAIAGVRSEDIDIQVTQDSVSIRGSRAREKTVKDDDYLYQECYWGKFARSIILPQEVDPDGASVTFKNGILTIRLPKSDKRKTKKLKVKSD
jgi:HSP20 family protein